MDEIGALTGALGDAQKGVIQATIGKGMSYKEFADISKNTGRRISWTALLSGLQGAGSYKDQLRKSEELIAAGHDVVPQVTCRPLNFEFNFKAPFVFESARVFNEVSAADFEGRKKVYADPEFREKFKQMLTKPGNTLGAGFSKAIVSNCKSDPGVNERILSDVAEEQGKHIVDTALDLSLANELKVRFRVAVANNNEEEVQELLDHPSTVLGLSDAGAHASQLCDACFSTHLLGHWVRDKGTIPIERAIRMLTSYLIWKKWLPVHLKGFMTYRQGKTASSLTRRALMRSSSMVSCCAKTILTSLTQTKTACQVGCCATEQHSST